MRRTGVVFAAGIALAGAALAWWQARSESNVAPSSEEMMVRIAVLEIDPAQLDAYKAILREEQEASVRLEPGVLMLHSVQLAEDQTQIRLLEVYASRSA